MSVESGNWDLILKYQPLVFVQSAWREGIDGRIREHFLATRLENVLSKFSFFEGPLDLHFEVPPQLTKLVSNPPPPRPDFWPNFIFSNIFLSHFVTLSL